MSTNMKTIILGVTIFLFAIVSMVAYVNTKSYRLVREALVHYDSGELYEARDKVNEAIKASKTNRRAIVLRPQIEFEIKSIENLASAKSKYHLGNEAYRLKNFPKAVEEYSLALGYLGKISTISKEYEEADELKRDIFKKGSELDDYMAKHYYQLAMNSYKIGDYLVAYNHLESSPKETKQIVTLRDEIAFKLGSSRYEEIMSTTDAPDSYTIDARYWLLKITSSSKHYSSAQKMLSELGSIK